RTGRSGIGRVAAWDAVADLRPRVAGLVAGVDPKSIPRPLRRGMGTVAQYAALATQQAVAAARLGEAELRGGTVGLALGSTTGSPLAIGEFYKTVDTEGVRGLRSTDFLKCMSHTCAANVAVMLGLTGRVLSPNSACTSGAQAIGLSWELISAGMEDVMLAGGAEEVHYTTAATFDIVGAASHGFNDAPSRTPRPFDARRDGLVVAEGAGVLVLEEWERAVRRDATIYGEVLSFATTCDGEHMAQPAPAGMHGCMARALERGGLAPRDVDYINAHATGTDVGDPAEAEATRRLFGDAVPVSSSKGYTGHTLGACGAIESIFCLLMMRGGFLAPTLNLEEVDQACRGLRHVTEVVAARPRRVMNNNFAFGGINTSLVLGAA
ncbi:MAG TPA: beta-ketoacyl synthase N-terminal-like domain-containing protein, partial [Myxococcota bacterium]|nr:beta-ketoacyl synthase N-terminal-like domain-containing protein [Myxococcota bacterium]